MKDAKTSKQWLIVISITLLLVFSSVLYIQYRQSALLNSTLRVEEDNISWNFFQMELESQRFREALLHELNQPDEIDRDNLQLRFDIFSSRFGVVMDGRGAALLADYEEFTSTLGLMEDFLDKNLIYFGDEAPTGMEATALHQILQDLEQLRNPLRELSLAAVDVTGLRAEARSNEVKRQIRISTGLILFQSALTILFAFIVIRQIRQLDASRSDLRILAGQLEHTNAALNERASALTIALEAADQSYSELSSYIQAIDQHALVSIADADGRMIQVNDRFVASHGYSREELLGQDYRLLNSGAHDKEFMAAIWDTLSQNRIWRGEICNRIKSGEVVWTDCAIVPLQNSHRKDARYISLSIDITKRKEAETKLLNAMRMAESANAAKSEFLANMSHEIRTPMNGIIGMNELAMATEDRQEQHEYLRLVKSSAHSLLIIVNDILDFSKIEAGQMVLERIPFTLQDLLPDIVKSVAVRIGNKDVELLYEIHPDVAGHLIGDPERLRQIVLNLLGNAVKFTQQGEIVLSVTRECIDGNDTVLHFSVKDTGIGIPADKQSGIFQAFSQADSSTTRRYGGTGLGLSICSRLVELMNGKIWLESTPGIGSTFHFTARFGYMADVNPVSARVGLAGMPVLIVDDNMSSRRILSDMLQQWNMQPTAVGCIELLLGALRKAKVERNSYALVLLDERVLAAAEERVVRLAQDELAQTGASIVLMTMNGIHDTISRREFGVSSYLAKPVTQSGLLEAIQAALDMGKVQPQVAPVPGVSDVAAATTHLSILLAEDNEINQRLAITLLQRAGHSVTVANNGRLAVEAWERDKYDLVLMDMQMPEMGGIEATQHIRQKEQERGEHIPIVAMTANAMNDDRERCLAAGMDDYLSKPISSAKLFAVLDAVMQKQGHKPGRSVSQDKPQSPPAPAVAPATKDFDYAAAIAAADREMLEIIGAMTVEAIPQHLATIEKALLQNQTDEVRRIAHTLKGALGYFGAKPVVDWARKMELYAEEGKMDAARDCYKPLQDELSKFQPIVAAMYGNAANESL